MTKNNTRPDIQTVQTATELKKWYWLKAELVSLARQFGVAYSCNKPELLSRLCHWLETGEKVAEHKRQVLSTFDWSKAPLSKDTVITDSYRNTQNMRRFMRKHAADHFAFSNEFMAWMKAAQGKTLQEAIEFWLALDRKKKLDGYREKPLPQNQYNQFSRAISRAKPGISASEIRRIWALKIMLPGPHVYSDGDESL